MAKKIKNKSGGKKIQNKKKNGGRKFQNKKTIK